MPEPLAPRLGAGDIEAIERATLAAVSPRAIEPLGQWLLAFDSGSIGRARSAVPLRHADVDGSFIDAIEARYAAHGLPPWFRIADDPRLSDLHEALRRRGYRMEQPSLVQIAPSQTILSALQVEPAEIAAAPDEAWSAVFLGPGFDPDDGRHRVRALAAAADAVFASVREDGRTVAVGMLGFGSAWAGVHGMRTDQAYRGRGLAARVLAGLAGAARRRGIERVFLQVDADNLPALALYRRAGFATAWRYAYWLRC